MQTKMKQARIPIYWLVLFLARMSALALICTATTLTVQKMKKRTVRKNTQMEARQTVGFYAVNLAAICSSWMPKLRLSQQKQMNTTKKSRESAIVIINPLLFHAIPRTRMAKRMQKAIMMSRQTMHLGKHRTRVRQTNEIRTEMRQQTEMTPLQLVNTMARMLLLVSSLISVIIWRRAVDWSDMTQLPRISMARMMQTKSRQQQISLTDLLVLGPVCILSTLLWNLVLSWSQSFYIQFVYEQLYPKQFSRYQALHLICVFNSAKQDWKIMRRLLLVG